jgi:hypothetical protein
MFVCRSRIAWISTQANRVSTTGFADDLPSSTRVPAGKPASTPALVVDASRSVVTEEAAGIVRSLLAPSGSLPVEVDVLRGTRYGTITVFEAIRQVVKDRKDRSGSPSEAVGLCAAAKRWRNVDPSCPSPIPCRYPNSERSRKVKSQPRRSRRRAIGAGEGNRTLVCSLGSCRSTIELHPRGEADSSGFRKDASRRGFQPWARYRARSPCRSYTVLRTHQAITALVRTAISNALRK